MAATTPKDKHAIGICIRRSVVDDPLQSQKTAHLARSTKSNWTQPAIGPRGHLPMSTN
jgi:hypothetical protein